MIAASVFVLSALTLTGVYMASLGQSKDEDNRIDFAKLEQQTQEQELADERFAGEGAGFAGGIVSAAVDGIKVAERIIEKYYYS